MSLGLLCFGALGALCHVPLPQGVPLAVLTHAVL